VDEVEAASEEDYDTDSADGGERDGGAAQTEETQKNSAITCDGEEEERTPEECRDEMQK
jgi:hypothetical protein